MFDNLASHSVLRCPTCTGPLTLAKQPNRSEFPVRDGVIECVRCGSKFFIHSYVPQLLPKTLSAAIDRMEENMKKGKKAVSREELERAYQWIAKQLHIPMVNLTGKWATVSRSIAVALRISEELGLNLAETHEIVGITGSHLMSPGYKKHVADQMYASLEAVSYERYEDIVLRTVLNSFLLDNPVILIEVGSGVGRLLIQYGSCVSDNPQAARPYRRSHPMLYGQDSLQSRDNLKYIIGLDYEWRMIQAANRWLRHEELYDLVSDKGRIAQILGSTFHLPLSFNGSSYEDTMRIVCILFQTLGNQTHRELQVDMLRRAWQLASPSGVLLVSVFNEGVFDEQAKAYYSSISKSVGPSMYCRNGVFFSSRAVYSKWFRPDELRRLFADAGVRDYLIYDGRSLPHFTKYKSYLSLEKQEMYKRRAIIGVGCSNSEQLARVKNLIKVEHDRQRVA